MFVFKLPGRYIVISRLVVLFNFKLKFLKKFKLQSGNLLLLFLYFSVTFRSNIVVVFILLRSTAESGANCRLVRDNRHLAHYLCNRIDAGMCVPTNNVSFSLLRTLDKTCWCTSARTISFSFFFTVYILVYISLIMIYTYISLKMFT